MAESLAEDRGQHPQAKSLELWMGFSIPWGSSEPLEE